MAAPILPAQWQSLIITTSANFCLAFVRALLNLPVYLYQQFNWQFDASGNVSDAFRQQLWPVGSVILMAAGTTPAGRWLECNGQQLTRTEYIDLFNVIGEVFGAPSPTTFKVPHLAGRAPIGTGVLEKADGTSGLAYNIGEKKGEESVTLNRTQIPDKPPPLADTAYKLFVRVGGAGGQVGPGGAGPWESLTPGETFKDEDNAQSHENRGPSLVMKYWIAY